MFDQIESHDIPGVGAGKEMIGLSIDNADTADIGTQRPFFKRIFFKNNIMKRGQANNT